MTRALVCGGDDLRHAAAVLQLTVVDDRPELALVDLRRPDMIARAATLPPSVPRIVVCAPEQRPTLVAAGLGDAAIAESAEPADLGPLVFAAMPTIRRPTRTVAVTASRGGVGRTLLVANLAVRVAPLSSVAVLDLTGSGALGWWLRTACAPWSDLESLAGELSADHLAVLGQEVRPGLRVLGGRGGAPSNALATAALAAALELAEIVLVDGPTLAEPRTALLTERADRVLEVAYEDPASLSCLSDQALPSWLIASQSFATRLGGREVFRALPPDARAVGEAMRSREPVRGALGRAYDDLADLIAIDAGA